MDSSSMIAQLFKECSPVEENNLCDYAEVVSCLCLFFINKSMKLKNKVKSLTALTGGPAKAYGGFCTGRVSSAAPSIAGFVLIAFTAKGL